MSYGSSDVITIFSFKPYDNSAKVCWLLEELGVPYRREMMDWRERANLTPEYLAMNPMGSVPVLKRGDFAMHESGAICAFLADEFPEKGLAPLPRSSERAEYLKWSHFAVGTLESAWDSLSLFEKVPAEHQPEGLANVRETVADACAALEERLLASDYVLGDRFSAADIAIGYHLYWIERGGKLRDYPALGAYLERLKARPAAKRAQVFTHGT